MTTEIINEEWKDIQEYDNLFQVSSTGRVKIKKRDTSFINKYGTKVSRVNQEKILYQRQFTGRNPYPVVYLRGEVKSVHRLVAIAFIPNPENKPCVNHKDGNPRNNIIENLEWVTISENILHAYRLGLKRSIQGEKCVHSKLNNTSVANIITDLRLKTKKSIIAKKYGVSYDTIKSISNGETWKHLNIDLPKIYDDRSNVSKDSIEKRFLTLSATLSKTNRKPVFQYDLNGNLIGEYRDFCEAERHTKVSRKSMRNSMKSNKPTCGFLWRANQ